MIRLVREKTKTTTKVYKNSEEQVNNAISGSISLMTISNKTPSYLLLFFLQLFIHILIFNYVNIIFSCFFHVYAYIYTYTQLRIKIVNKNLIIRQKFKHPEKQKVPVNIF